MISIVIPAYNDEQYIEKCLDSISRQSFKDFEVILVLDGSTDATKQKAEVYCSILPKLIIVEQQNSGSGKARNHGVEISSGDYIVFVDADDWLEDNALKTLIDIELKTDADYIVANAVTVEIRNGKENRRYLGHTTDAFYTGDQVSKQFFQLDYDNSSHSPWGKLYKSSIIKTNKVQFPDLRRSQDIVFNNNYAKFISSIYVSSSYVYNFRNTIYTKKLLNEAGNRRNSEKFVQAELNHINTMTIVANSLFETFEYRNYILDEEELQKLYDGYLIGVYNNIEANTNRRWKNAKNVLKKYGDTDYVRNAVKSPRDVRYAYKIFAFFLKHHMYNIVVLYVSLITKLNQFIKKNK